MVHDPGLVLVFKSVWSFKYSQAAGTVRFKTVVKIPDCKVRKHINM